jgi:hypothetical protein
LDYVNIFSRDPNNLTTSVRAISIGGVQKKITLALLIKPSRMSILTTRIGQYRRAGAGQSEEAIQDRTSRTGHQEQDIKNRTTEQDNMNRTTEQDNMNRTVGKV